MYRPKGETIGGRPWALGVLRSALGDWTSTISPAAVVALRACALEGLVLRCDCFFCSRLFSTFQFVSAIDGSAVGRLAENGAPALCSQKERDQPSNFAATDLVEQGSDFPKLTRPPSSPPGVVEELPRAKKVSGPGPDNSGLPSRAVPRSCSTPVAVRRMLAVP